MFGYMFFAQDQTVLKFFNRNNLIHVGVPEEVIKRAAYVLEAAQNNKHVERWSHENISAQDQQYKVLSSEP